MTRDELVRAFETQVTRAVSARELMQLLRVPREGRVGLRRQLRALTDDGTLVMLRGRRYGLPGRMDTVVGRLSVHPDGYGFVRPEGHAEAGAGDVYVAAADQKDAMHGDRVAVRIDRARSARGPAGRVTQVVSRAAAQLIGRFDTDIGGRGRVVPHDPRVGRDLAIPAGEYAGAQPGQIVVAEVTRWPTETRGPSGRVVEVLGRIEEPGTDTRVVLRTHGIPEAHGDAALAEAAACVDAIPASEYARRTDFRSTTTVTIDGEHARDFDDAVSIERLADGFRLGVHIADVSHFVGDGSALDREALDRGTSVYFPERAIHMLPERLAAGVCSLNPGVDRLVMSCLMDIDRHGTVVRRAFHDGIIRSRARLTYTEVNAALADGDPEARARLHAVLPMLERLRDAFEVLHTRRQRRGAIDFDLPQPDIVLDASGLVEAIVPAERNVAHRMVEEFMLAANETVAQYLDERGFPAVYRVHDAPDPMKVQAFADCVAALGLPFTPHPSGVRPIDFQRLVTRMRGRPEEKPVAFLMLRTLQLARYEAVNRGHFGLALERYTHFTSPIRRYPDLLVHRQLRRARLAEATGTPSPVDEDRLADLARVSSERERRAVDAERELVRWKKARFMADKIGEEFDGVVTGVVPFGVFVELAEHFVEGLVHVATFGGVSRFDESRLALRHEDGASYRLGDRLRVRVVGVDLSRHQIALEPADADRQARPAAQSDRRMTRPRSTRPTRPARPTGRRAGGARRSSGRRRRREPAMTHFVVGTAGHIDHGKSALVLALTGTDPDRLKEEKARGITIDLGFAHWDAGDVRVAFVDVPGHERFVKNMLAGVGGIDLVALVVAADESVMPQTREHFDICRLLQVRAGIVVLTKCDLVDADMLELVQMDVADLVRGSFLEGAPVVPASSRTGAGLAEVRAAIVEVATRLEARSAGGAARLPIDRVFTMKGFGTVATGTLVSGRLAPDAEVAAMPGEREIKVRGLQVHGEPRPGAVAGQRVAVNVAGPSAAGLVRGDVLATPGSLTTTRVVDVRLDVLGSVGALRHGARVRFHQGTTEVLGRVAVSRVVGDSHEARSAAAEIPGGRSAFARLRLERTAVLTRGDRFIVRAYSPPSTIAGGTVLDPQPPRGGIRTAAGRERFERLDRAAGPEAVAEAFVGEGAAEGLTTAALVARAGLTPDAAAGAVRVLSGAGRVRPVGDRVVAASVHARLADALLALVGQYHRAQPLLEGVPREEARERVCAHAAPGLFDQVVDDLVTAGRLVARDRLALAGHRLALTPDEESARVGLERAYYAAALAPPGLGEVAASLGVNVAVVEKVAALLVRQKVLVRVDTLHIHADALVRLKEALAMMRAAAGGQGARLDVAAFKERFGVSRKYAIPLLEYLDRERVTRRVGDARMII